MNNLCYYGDSPVASTGIGKMSKHILKALHDTGEYNIVMTGLNHNLPYYDREEYPYEIYPSNFDKRDPEGLARFMMTDMITSQDVPIDTLFINYDTNVVVHLTDPGGEMGKNFAQAKLKKGFKFIAYMPVDAPFVTQNIMQVADVADHIVTYSEFGRDIILKRFPDLKNKTHAIQLGVDTKIFKPLADSKIKRIRQRVLNLPENAFLVGNINRNQWRKDLFRTIWAYLLFYKKHPNAYLYLHCKTQDMGGDVIVLIATICEWLELDPAYILKNRIKLPPQTMHTTFGLPEQILNKVYNSLDVFLSTTLGEGWGLTACEALATETPVILANNTTAPEILGDNEHGYLIDQDGWTVSIPNSTVPRTTTDINHTVELLEEVYQNREKAKQKAKSGRRWIEKRSWDIIGKKWVKFMDEHI